MTKYGATIEEQQGWATGEQMLKRMELHMRQSMTPLLTKRAARDYLHTEATITRMRELIAEERKAAG
jgi:hypothetical protein